MADVKVYVLPKLSPQLPLSCVQCAVTRNFAVTIHMDYSHRHLSRPIPAKNSKVEDDDEEDGDTAASTSKKGAGRGRGRGRGRGVCQCLACACLCLLIIFISPDEGRSSLKKFDN